MNGLLDVRINADHAGVEVWVIAHQHLWIPRAGDEDGVDAAAEWGCEDVADLQADEEGEGDNDWRV